MDEDGEYIAEDGSSAQSNTTNDNDDGSDQHTAHEEILRLSPSKSTRIHDHHTAKWLRLKKHYNDRYLELFNTTYGDDVDDKALDDTQFGSVRWTGLEKSAFFTALKRKGRHDLAGLAAAVQTKSEIEIIDYLDRLKHAETERQMFASRAKNVTPTDIEAAIEIGEGCETMLENAADALAAYQECYDQVSATHQIDRLWLIDADVAQTLDALSDSVDDGQLGDEAYKVPTGGRPVYELFHMSKFLELSRRLFMNMPLDSEHAHWTQLSNADESPSIATDAMETFYSLVVSIVRRVVQTAVFLAQSRIRAIQATDQTPAQTLKEGDVEAALDVLNMPSHGFDYWVGWVKRSKVEVTTRSHAKGQSIRQVLSLQQIEEILSIRATRGRSSSLSSLVSMTSTEASTIGESDSEGHSLAVDEEIVRLDSSDANRSPSAEPLVGSNSDSNDQDSESESSEIHERSNDIESVSQSAESQYISRKRRLQILASEQDEYLERFDQASRHHEEAYLYQALGDSRVKTESPESSGWHPSIQRKTNEELHNWSDVQYRAPWESLESVEDHSNE